MKPRLLSFPLLFTPEKIGVFFLFFFLFLFPKGGIKIVNIPITWGYLLLMLFAIGHLKQKSFYLERKRLFSLIALFPFQMYTLFSLFYFGFESYDNSISFICSFFFLPLVFFGLFSKAINEMDESFFLSLIKKGTLFLALFGIFLFFFKIFTGKFFSIPLLTINLHDFGMLESKSIDRGYAFKLISTYNNGNIFGICMLMILPLYLHIEDKNWKKTILFIALFLTLSRTVWAGMLFSSLLLFLFTPKKKLSLLLIALFLSFFIASFLVFDLSFTFIFDPTLGGREHQIQVLNHLHFFPHDRFHGIYEMVYLAILDNFGLLGLLLFLIALIFPIGIFFLQKAAPISSKEKALLIGLFSYLFVCLSDGAILYIPTMAFYWFIASWIQKPSFCKKERKNS